MKDRKIINCSPSIIKTNQPLLPADVMCRLCEVRKLSLWSTQHHAHENDDVGRRRIIMWSDRRGGWGSLCIVTQSNILLTQTLDGDETESAGLTLMTEYPCTVSSSSEAPCSQPQYQLGIAAKSSFFWATLRTANRNTDVCAFQQWFLHPMNCVEKNSTLGLKWHAAHNLWNLKYAWH